MKAEEDYPLIRKEGILYLGYLGSLIQISHQLAYSDLP